MPEEDRSDKCFLRAPLPAFSCPCSRAPRSWWPRLWQQPAAPRWEPSVLPPLPPTSSSLPNSTSPHPCAVYPLLNSATGQSPWETGQPPNISSYSEDNCSSLCIREKLFFFFSCGVGAPILRIRANDRIVSPVLPTKCSNLSSCSDQSSQDRQDGGNNICSKEVNSFL